MKHRMKKRLYSALQRLTKLFFKQELYIVPIEIINF